MAEENKGNISDSVQSQMVSNREKMLEAAVKFLQNPLVQRTSTVQQEAFLKSKGLTDEELKHVLQQAVVQENKVFSPEIQSNLVVPPIPERNYRVLALNKKESSIWDSINSIIILCGLTYGIYQFYKKYLHHIWYGSNEENERNTKLEETCYKAIEGLHTSVEAMNEKLKELHEQQEQKHLTNSYVTAKQLNELKAEIASVKSLLLSRHQFAPPVFHPKLVPSIPSWQLEADTEDTKGSEEEATNEGKDDGDGEMRTSGSGSSDNDIVTTNGSDSSLEMISKNP